MVPELDRAQLAQIAERTDRICAAGVYDGPDGSVDIAEAVNAAVRGTLSYPPQDDGPDAEPHDRSHRADDRFGATRIVVRNETTLSAAARLSARRLGAPAVLNFASAEHPGGGYRSGARAQEASLARASALVPTLLGQPMYRVHRERRDPLSSDWVLYSPGVPVFGRDDGSLLGVPYTVGFLSCAAPNAREAAKADAPSPAMLAGLMRRRIERVLGIAAAQGHRGVVLGAWGCGVLGNDAAMVAREFAAALAGPMRGVFDEVVFAILDEDAARVAIRPFAAALGVEAVDVGVEAVDVDVVADVDTDTDTNADPGGRLTHRAHKAEVHALASLTKQLVALPPHKLAELSLPATIVEAIVQCRGFRKGARIRQLRRISGLLRSEEPEALAVRLSDVAVRGSERLRRQREHERWRDRLLAEGDAALTALVARHPAADRQRLRQLMRAVARGPETGKGKQAFRALLVEIRAADATTP